MELASGEQTLCLLPAKFNKKLWVKRGGFLIVALGNVDATESVTGTIIHVLYEADVRRLKAMPSVWYAPFTGIYAAYHTVSIEHDQAMLVCLKTSIIRCITLPGLSQTHSQR